MSEEGFDWKDLIKYVLSEEDKQKIDKALQRPVEVRVDQQPSQSNNENNPTETDIRKDSLKTNLKIMEYVMRKRHLKDGEKASHSSITQEFPPHRYGKNAYWVFHEFCGVPQPKHQGETLCGEFASMTYTGKKDNNNEDIILTPAGIRKLFELKESLAKENNDFWIKWATIVMAAFMIIQSGLQLYQIIAPK